MISPTYVPVTRKAGDIYTSSLSENNASKRLHVRLGLLMFRDIVRNCQDGLGLGGKNVGLVVVARLEK